MSAISINDVNRQSQERRKIDFIEKAFEKRIDIMKRYTQLTTSRKGRKSTTFNIFRFNEDFATGTATSTTETEHRRWLYIENNKFFCLYCLLFPDIITDSKSKKQGQAQDALLNYFVNGMDFTDPSIRVCQNLNRHESSVHHKLRTIYVKKLLRPNPHSAGANANVPVVAVPVREQTGTPSNNYDDDASITSTVTTTPTVPTQHDTHDRNANGNTLRNAVDCIIKIIIHIATHGM
jgi:hypothetical protein